MPAYNEADYIIESVRETIKTLSSADLDFEVIVVDDGSSDATLQKLETLVCQFPRAVRAFSYPSNRGKGFALAAGVRNSRGSTIAFLDADLDLHPSQLVSMVEIMSATSSDVVIGSKWHPNSKLDYPLLRKIYSRLYYTIVRALFAFTFRDTQTGAKVFRAEPILRALPRMLNKTYAFDLELLAVIHRLGYNIIEAPVTVEYTRPVGRINWRDAMAMLLDTAAIYYRLNLLRYYDRDNCEAVGFDHANVKQISAQQVVLVGEN